jgi:hypothetical protein
MYRFVAVVVLGADTLIRLLHLCPISPGHTFSILKPYPAACPGSLARQPCPEALPGSLARQSCPAALPGSLAESLQV